MEFIRLMNVQSFSAVIACLVNITIAVLVFTRNRKSIVHITFSLLSISMAWWSFGDFFTYFPGIRDPLRSHIINTGLVMLPALSFHFILSFLKRNSGLNRVVLRFLYLIGFIGLIVSWTRFSLNDMFFAIFSGVIFPLLFYELYLVINESGKRASAIDKNRFKYMTSAMVVMIAGGLSEALTRFGIRSYPVALLANMFYSLIMAFTILRYNMLNIKLAAGRTFVLTVLAFIVSGVYFLIIFIWKNTPELMYSTLIILSFVFIVTIPLIRKKVYNLLQGLFSRERYKYHDILRKLSDAMSSTVNLDELLGMITDKLQETLKIKSMSIYIMDKYGFEFRVSSSGSVVPYKSEITPFKLPVLLEKLREGRVLIKDEIEGRMISSGEKKSLGLLTDMEKVSGQLYVPVGREESFKGFILLDGSIMSRITYFEDIELLKSLAGQLSVAVKNSEIYKEMNQKERLATLGTMAAGIAHEVKNPLSSIKSATQNLRDEIKNEEDREYFNIILEEVDRLDNIVTDLLLYARPGEPELKVYDVSKTIESAIKLVENKQNRKIEFIRDFPGNFNERYIRPEHLKQVLLNLLINSASAIEGKGTIKVHIKKTTRNNNPYVELVVSDNGRGIPKEYMDKIFQPFFSKKEKGSGLGLAVVNTIIEGYKGSISVKSAQNKGTDVSIIVPVA